MVGRYSDMFECVGEDCIWSELYSDKRRVNFVKWRLLEEQLSTELSEDEFCFLCRYISRAKNNRATSNAEVSTSNLKVLLIKYRAWRDESLSLF